ncbi:MAG: hypothetical protein KDD56_10625 [Bdellovibrionales bacterium]|nr:hypothetical protein [Bdellovibrionales bacterium]
MQELISRIWNRIELRLDPWERSIIKKMRKDAKFLFLSELIPFFENTHVYCFGTGGSVANLPNLGRLRDKNLMIVTSGPIHFFRTYKVVPNIWIIHNADSVKMFLKEEESSPLDFSNTFILVPANDSYSKLHFSSIEIKQLRERHPEATFVVYREIFPQINNFILPENFMKKGIEPLRSLHGSVLEALFAPIAGYLGIKGLYFSGIDQLPTGHFWDRKFYYQDINGKPLNFPEHENTLKINNILASFSQQIGFDIFRLEKEETILKLYPYLDFEDSLKLTSPIITPELIKNQIVAFE